MSALPTMEDVLAPRVDFRDAVRLAYALLYPLEGFSPAPVLEPFDAEGLMRAARGPFRRPLNRAAASSLGLPDVGLDAESLRALSAGDAGALALRLLLEPRPAVEAAALSLAAVAHSGQLLVVALKPERDRLRAIFGDLRFRIATREAPMLWTRVGALGLPGDTAPIHAADVPVLDARGVAISAGLALLGRFALAVDAVVADLFARRTGRPRAAAPMPHPAAAQLVRLLAPGGTAWSVPIA